MRTLNSDNTLSTDLLQEREKRINDAIALREPDRVPVMSMFGFLPAKIAGITFEEAMYDYDKTMQAWTRAMVEFEPDAYDDPYPSRYWGKIMERLDSSSTVAKIFCFKISGIQARKGGVALHFDWGAVSRFS
jgi:hypothetical protein